MRRIVKVVAGIMGFVVLAVLLALRIALAAVLAVITPIFWRPSSPSGTWKSSPIPSIMKTSNL